jgi:hypothetical protein
MLVLKVSTYMTTSITDRLTRFVVILVIMSVSTFIIAVILYRVKPVYAVTSIKHPPI